MREALRATLLALSLCALTAGATEPPPVAFTDAFEQTLLPGYEEVQSTAESTSAGDLAISVNRSLARPPRGYLALEVVLHNRGTAPRSVGIGVDSPSAPVPRIVTRRVEVGAHQRVSTWMLVPVTIPFGIVRFDSPGLTLRDISFHSMQPSGQALLVVGSEEAFQTATALPRQKSDATLVVRFLSEEAPRELAAYVGYPEVVVAGDVTALPADVWSALEAYAATGGVLTLLSPPRDVAARLPLMAGESQGRTFPHGFGQVRLCDGGNGCIQELLAGAEARAKQTPALLGAVHPLAPPNKWDSNSDGLVPLLPGVQAPVGQLLGFITLFVLLVGPGGVALARRKGPLMLLVAVPAVSLVTCVAIVAWSVFIEGFALHAARYSVTRLDRERDRAVTVAIGGYYANLAPDSFQVPVLGALMSSNVDWDNASLQMDMTQGLSVTGGFLSPRTYQEWGEVEMRPSRVRLVVRPEGQEVRVLNALGAPLSTGIVHTAGAWWRLPELAEGEEGLATRMSWQPIGDAMDLGLPSTSVQGERMSQVLRDVYRESLPEEHFIATLRGVGATFTRELPVRLHEGIHVVRGRVDGP